MFKPPEIHYKAVVLLWFSNSYFWCQSFGDVSLYVCLYYFSSVSVAECPPFGKKLLTRLTICSLCILTICNISYFPFWFKVWIWFLIASVPDL